MTVKEICLSPRQHQVEAIRSVRRSFISTNRSQVVMACGTGKSLVGMEVLNGENPKRAVVLAPTISLVKQLLDGYCSQCDMERILVVCSDNKAAREAREKYAIQKVTTNPDTIGRAIRKTGGSLIVFGTYASCDRIAEAYSLGKTPAFDLAIMDEAHRLAGRDSERKAILHDDRIPVSKRLFMTATPRISSENTEKASEAMGITVHSMDDEAKFGKVAHRLDFSESIDRGLLTDYRVVVIRVSDEDIRGILRQDQNREFVAKQVGVAKAMKKYNLQKMVMFFSSNVRAGVVANRDFPELFESMKERGEASGDLWIRQLSGHDNVGHRGEVLNEFASMNGSSRAVITNSRILGEGVDLPELGSISIMDPMNSQVNIVQAVGRAIRRSEGKEIATIVIPVFVSGDEEEATSALQSGPYQSVYRVLLALRDHDNRFEDYIRSVSQSHEMSKGDPPIKLPENIVFDGFTDQMVIKFSADVAQLRSSRPMTEERFRNELSKMDSCPKVGDRNIGGSNINTWKSAIGSSLVTSILDEFFPDRVRSIPWTEERLRSKLKGLDSCPIGRVRLPRGGCIRAAKESLGKPLVESILDELFPDRSKRKSWTEDRLRDELSEFESCPHTSIRLPGGSNLGDAKKILGKPLVESVLDELFPDRPKFLLWTEDRLRGDLSKLASRPMSHDRLPCGSNVSQARRSLGKPLVKSLLDEYFPDG